MKNNDMGQNNAKNDVKRLKLLQHLPNSVVQQRRQQAHTRYSSELPSWILEEIHKQSEPRAALKV
jgi:hypothetical protein